MKQKLFIKYLGGKRAGHFQVRREPTAIAIDDIIAALLTALRKAGLPTKRDDLLLRIRRRSEDAAVHDGLLMTSTILAYFLYADPHTRRGEAERYMFEGLDHEEFYLANAGGDACRLLNLDVLPPAPELPELVDQFWSTETGLVTLRHECAAPEPMRS